MGWAIGFDEHWKRDIGYGVPAYCDHPDCNELIDRGLAYVCCGEEPYGGDGCGLYFCENHKSHVRGKMFGCCERCAARRVPFKAKPDRSEWVEWKRTDPSWAEWRATNEGLEFMTLADRVKGE